MRILSLWQPWASLIALGFKTIETRSWATKYRGLVAIHATIKLPMVWLPFKDRSFVEALEPIVGLNEMGVPNIDRLPVGAILAVANLVECLPIFGFDDDLGLGPTARFGQPWPSDDPDDDESLAQDGWWRDMGIPVMHPNQAPFGHFAEGRFAWFLEDVLPLRVPVAIRGRQGLANLPEATAAHLAGVLGLRLG